MKVEPKIVGAAKALADAENEFRAFQKKNEIGDRRVFTKTLEYYVDALKFNSGKAMAGLNDEIEVLKRLIEETN